MGRLPNHYNKFRMLLAGSIADAIFFEAVSRFVLLRVIDIIFENIFVLTEAPIKEIQ
jgi:hypothetical protein